MTEPIKAISNPKLRLEILSETDLEKIHQATLQIIERTGVRFPSKWALDLWREHGADVDENTQIVKVKGEIIEAAIKLGKPIYPLAARDPELDLSLDDNHVYLGTDGCGVQVQDLYNGELRPSTLKDVEQIATVADYLPEIAFHWVPVSAQDRPPETRGLHEIKAVWGASTKHVQTESIYSLEEAKAAVEMATILAGSSSALRERPLLSIMQCTAPPLGQDGGSLDAALVAAEAGLPVGFMTMTSSLTTAPATLAGNLAVGNAEVISAAALIQLTYPGSPFFYAAAQTASDLRTGGYTGGGPEDFLFGAATNSLANYYNMPLSMGSFATGAKEPNWQAGIENSLSTFMASISMSDMLLGAGLLHGSRIFSYEQLLLDCEIYDIIYQMMKGIEVNEETLALDTIHAVGPGGNYLAQKHTLNHMRELWQPKFFDRRSYEEWTKKQDDGRDWAREKARQILETHTVGTPLDPKIVSEFERIISALEKK
jgi:trimethylamine--corrinoid protein Co-methyltransferase